MGQNHAVQGLASPRAPVRPGRWAEARLLRLWELPAESDPGFQHRDDLTSASGDKNKFTLAVTGEDTGGQRGRPRWEVCAHSGPDSVPFSSERSEAPWCSVGGGSFL